MIRLERSLQLLRGEHCKPQVGILYLELVEEMRKISRHLENIHDRAAMFYGKFPKARNRVGREEKASSPA